MSRQFLRAILRDDRQEFDRLRPEVSSKDLTERENWNYLHRALINPAMNGSAEMIQLLVSWGVDVGATDIYGNTPLHYAARSKNAKAIEILVGAGAGVNRANEEGVTPLREALSIQPGSLEVIKILLNAGANLDQEGAGGLTDREFANLVLGEQHDIRRLVV